jgi:hypothetical protein
MTLANYPKHWLCPINQTRCGHGCFLRHACTTQPAKVNALLERLDPQTEDAMVEHVQRLQR